MVSLSHNGRRDRAVEFSVIHAEQTTLTQQPATINSLGRRKLPTFA